MSQVDEQDPSAVVRPPPPDGHGPLQPIEMATASVLGAMTVVLVIAGWFLPHATAVTAFGTVPMAVIAHRHRPRAVVAAVVASASVGFLVAGIGVISTIILCGLIGGMAGHAHRRHWGVVRLVAAASVAGPMVAAVAVGLLVVFSALRKLTLEQLRNTWRGLSGVVGRLVSAVPGQSHAGLRATADLDGAVAWAIRNWWEAIAILLVAFTVGATVVAWYLLDVLFVRLERVRAVDRLAASGAGVVSGPPAGAGAGSTSVPEPVPVQLRDVTVRYPGAGVDALAGVSLRIEAGQMVAVLGPNGSGKSTFSRVLAGCAPTGGEVARAGDVGLGMVGGTAMVSQRPESQVLGVRVLDDLVWGLPREFEVDTVGLLAAVGLSGMEQRETSSLSGGQLQRLAVADALARRPRLLISDESTAMIDALGRRRLVDLLTTLSHDRGVTVAHVTHHEAETLRADRIIVLERGHVISDDARRLPVSGGAASGGAASGEAVSGGAVADATGAGTGDGSTAPTVPPPTVPPPTVRGPVVLRLRGVGHVYAEATPWAQVALHDVDLDVRAGEGVLIVGDNGSGKSTLAWIIAGLLRPSFGNCDLDGDAVHHHVGEVGLAFQHSRLQVQRSTVGRDVGAAGDVDRPEAEAALRRVGLDPEQLWDRAVDELSGGQLRRVALAGLLTRTPPVLVLDEPLAGLDGASRASLVAVLADLRATHGVTLVVISHDLEGAGDLCDRVVRLEAGAIVSDDAVSGGAVAASGVL